MCDLGVECFYTKNKCAKCEYCLKGKKYDIDHVRPLSNGGTNELNNLQVLCKACHQDKTANEQENGQFVKFSDTESCLMRMCKKS
jgi:5-methylcytosine-specific restriction endonuclease McrA